MKKLFLISFLFIWIGNVLATHNRAGEITYTKISGFTYEITITTYTDPLSVNADRCELVITIEGTNSTFIDTISRVNDDGISLCQCSNGNCGELVSSTIKKNIYKLKHTFPGFDNYIISMTDPNRNAGIVNIVNSVDIPFFIQNTFTPNAFIGLNSSPILVNPPLDNGCVNKVYEYNNMAVDPDGDSLSYSLIPCFSGSNQPITLYMMPNFAPNNIKTGELSIDAYTGNIIWDSPKFIGEYNFCVLIEEFRQGIKIGEVVRDMQITISNCTNNPPVLDPINDVCVIAGDSIDFDVTANDPDSNLMLLWSSSFLYDLPVPIHPTTAAQFDSVTGGNPLTSHFHWDTECGDVKNGTYLVNFKVKDNNAQASLQDFSTMQIQVISPPPTNPTATPNGNNIDLSWTPTICSQAINYKIYKHADSLGFKNGVCETGVPASTGYQLLATVPSSQTTYSDNANLVQGQEFCYIVVACFKDGAESIASEEFCAELKKDVPVITRVSVNATSETIGSDTITWSMPTELDSVQYVGPYRYDIYREGALIGSSNTSAILSLVDTLFIDSILNTQSLQHFYRIILYSGLDTVGGTQTASSIFVMPIETDNMIILDWSINVPWTNSKFVIYKKNKQTLLFESLDTTSLLTYSDTGLTNGIGECYLIKSIGKYPTKGFIEPIENFSQEICAIPIDNVPPCAPPNTFINADCKNDNIKITWDNPNLSCSDDAVYYKIYFAPEIGVPLQLIDSINNSMITEFSISELVSIAGCYGVTAVDTFFNESDFGEILCVDNCPNYELPNVFTPGGDGVNDLFIPFPYKFIESIDLTIYNRWGGIVFETNNPDIKWDGRHQKNNRMVSEGVYYYVGTVNEIRLSGIEKRIIKGFIHVIYGQDHVPN